MRELRFRAWHILAHKYLKGSTQDVFKWKEENQLILIEQFSGILDCKGKEVYEGDVLRETIEHDMGDENLYCVVKWFQPTCSFVAMSYADTVTDWEDSEDSKEEYPTPLTPEDCKRLTVCGNEHQNPDWFTKD